MNRRLARKLAIAGLFGIVVFATACPPPWYFWRHERREERRDDRHDNRYERHDNRSERGDDHKERKDDHKERGH